MLCWQQGSCLEAHLRLFNRNKKSTLSVLKTSRNGWVVRMYAANESFLSVFNHNQQKMVRAQKACNTAFREKKQERKNAFLHHAFWKKWMSWEKAPTNTTTTFTAMQRHPLFLYFFPYFWNKEAGGKSRLNPNPNRHCKRKNALPTKNGFNLRKHTAGCRCKRSCCPVDKKRCLLPKRRWKQNKLLVERQMLDSGREIQKGEGKILDAVRTLATMETVTRKQTNQRWKQSGSKAKKTRKRGKKKCLKENILQNKHTRCVSGFVAASAFRPTGNIVTSFLVIKRGSSYALRKHQSATQRHRGQLAFSSYNAVFVARKWVDEMLCWQQGSCLEAHLRLFNRNKKSTLSVLKTSRNGWVVRMYAANESFLSVFNHNQQKMVRAQKACNTAFREKKQERKNAFLHHAFWKKWMSWEKAPTNTTTTFTAMQRHPLFLYFFPYFWNKEAGGKSRLNPNPNRHCKRKNALPTKNGFNLRKHTAGCRCKRSCCPVDKKRCLLPKRRWKQNKLLVERQMLDSGREIQKKEGKILDDVKTLATMETVTRKQTN